VVVGAGGQREADRVEGAAQVGGGDPERGHGRWGGGIGFGHHRLQFSSGVGEPGLQPGQVFGDERTDQGTVVAGGHERAHAGQRHADPAQPGQQACGCDLVGAVAPVAAAGVDL
jgi:hypothetical protein